MRTRWWAIIALVAALAFAACGDDTGSDAPGATLRVHGGLVEVDAGAGFSTGSDGQSLSEGNTVRTGSDGRAAIEWFDGSVTRLDFGTTFTIVTMEVLEGDGTVIEGEQTSGGTYNRIAELTDSASRFAVDTPTSTASVQGTVFAVLFNADGTITYAVLDGTVLINGVEVMAGEMVTVDEEGNVGEPEPIPEGLIDDEWMVYNCELDDGPDCLDGGATTTTTVAGPEEPTTTTSSSTTTSTTTTTRPPLPPTTTPATPPTTATTVALATTTTVAPTTTTTVGTGPTVPPTTTTTTTVPPTTTTVAGPEPPASSTTTTSTTMSPARSLFLDGSTAVLRNGCSRTYLAFILVGGQVVDEDNTLVTFADIAGGGDAVTVSGGGSVLTVDGVATALVTGQKPGKVTLQASTGDGLVSNSIEFDVGGNPSGACDEDAVLVGVNGSDGFGDAPFGLATFAIMVLVGIGLAGRGLREALS